MANSGDIIALIYCYINNFFSILSIVDAAIWNYLGLLVITLVGLYLTLVSRGYQFRIIAHLSQHVAELMRSSTQSQPGVHPLSIYFASVGGMIGLGNLVGVVSALTLGGPGTLFWMWISALIGMLIKYSEIFLGITHRKPKKKSNGYDGGPMYYLQAAFRDSPFLCRSLPLLSAFFLCIYGADVSQFLIITDTLVINFGFDRWMTVIALLLLLGATTLGGIKHFSRICSIMMPPFMLSYTALGLWIIAINYQKLPQTLLMICQSAFTGHAAVGGFLGSSMLAAMHYGVSRAVYSGDIGIGYDSIVHSETRITEAEKQAPLAVIALLSNVFISSISVIMVLITDTWTAHSLQPSEYVGAAIATFLPASYVKFYTAALFFIAGFTTIAGFFVVGQKCSEFINQRFGRSIYIAYGAAAFTTFSFFDQNKVMLLMSVSGGILMIINLIGVFKLRREITFGSRRTNNQSQVSKAIRSKP